MNDYPQTLEDICKLVLARCKKLIPISSNLSDQDHYKNLKVKLGRKEKNWLTTDNLFRWDLNDISLAEKMNQDLDNTLVMINAQTNQKKRSFREILNDLDEIPNRFQKNAPKRHKNGLKYTDREITETIALNACRVQAGNCEELCSLAMALLHEYPLLQLDPIYSSQIGFKSPGDHVFILVHSKKRININDPSSWGKDAFIIDPWLNETYPVLNELSNEESTFASWVAIQNQLKDTKLFLVDKTEIAIGHSPGWKKSKTRKEIKFWSAAPEDFAKNKEEKMPIPFAESVQLK